MKVNNKKYTCPYCNNRDEVSKLIEHIEKDHEEMIPQEYTPARLIYDDIHSKNIKSGKCRVCKSPTDWDEKRYKYRAICNDPKCKKHLADIAAANMKRKTGKEKMPLNDPEFQRDVMLANRTISGEYKFRDGTKVKYAGSYERKALEFMDKTLEINSEDIMVPGPILEYRDKEGNLRSYIPDMYYIPYNLIIEIKDGGKNPNTRNMEVTRAKQKAKEEMIINGNKYNYLRLTDNNFVQLLEIFTELKYKMISDPKFFDNDKIIRINEEIGGLPPAGPSSAYARPVHVVAYGYKHVKSNDVEDHGYMVDNENIIVKDGKKYKKKKAIEFLENRLFDISTKSYFINELATLDLNNIEYGLKVYNEDNTILPFDKSAVIEVSENIGEDPNGYYYFDTDYNFRSKSFINIKEAYNAMKDIQEMFNINEGGI